MLITHMGNIPCFSSLALDEGGRIFLSLPLTFPAWLLSYCLVFSCIRETLSASLSKARSMELISWSLNAIDTIFSKRSLGSGEPTCPDRTFAAGYSMDAWEKWRVVCLAALSVEDVEDIFLSEPLVQAFC